MVTPPLVILVILVSSAIHLSIRYFQLRRLLKKELRVSKASKLLHDASMIFLDIRRYLPDKDIKHPLIQHFLIVKILAFENYLKISPDPEQEKHLRFLKSFVVIPLP